MVFHARHYSFKLINYSAHARKVQYDAFRFSCVCHAAMRCKIELVYEFQCIKFNLVLEKVSRLLLMLELIFSCA